MLFVWPQILGGNNCFKNQIDREAKNKIEIDW